MRKPIHWGAELLREKAIHIGGGYFSVTVLIAEGDTAWHPASTKKVLAGHGLIDYLLHESGDTATPGEGVHESYREPVTTP